VYTVAAAIKALGLRKSTLRREYREGRLRVSRRAGHNFILGAWLLEWLRGGELPRPDGRPARAEGPNRC
jgi:hypothetical protein